jgi:hypothetical protein
VYSRQVRRVEHRLAVPLAEVPGPRLLVHGRQVGDAARPKQATDLDQVRALVRDVLEDHRGEDGVERAVRDRRHGIRGRDDRLDPREAGGHAREPGGREVDRVDRPLGGRVAVLDERREERAVAAAEVGEGERAGR